MTRVARQESFFLQLLVLVPKLGIQCRASLIAASLVSPGFTGVDFGVARGSRFVNKLQPISVGVWMGHSFGCLHGRAGFLCASMKGRASRTNAHGDRSEVHFNSVFMSEANKIEL